MNTTTDLPTGEVRAYCDLHRRCSSLKAMTGEKKGKVVAKPKQVVLQDVRFEVSQAGLRRTREENVRSVHAFARGHVRDQDVAAVRDHPDAVQIRYNPHKFDTFVRADTLEPVATAQVFAIDGKLSYALGVA
ncbi:MULTISPECIES: hypothetical protein [Microvirga]|uniref:hypothetical protein n=1 Tax=Microvirga TaxID=186650 RepID=UPI0021C999E3|nr:MULTISPECIES: hypothetical protein [unclassified Microvirga]